MKIIDRLTDGRINISFEVFPPKKDEDYEKVAGATDQIAKLDPAFISVTYGRGRRHEQKILPGSHPISRMTSTCSALPISHAHRPTKEEVRHVIRNLKELGIEKYPCTARGYS